jgi:hypothetical protein
LLRVNKQIHHEAAPILYTQNVFCAHPTLLNKMPYLLLPSRPILSQNITSQIRRWYVSIRLDIDPRFVAEDVTRAFDGADFLEIEAWQPEYGNTDLTTLKMFEGVRGVKNTKVSGSVGAEYHRWLESCMKAKVGEVVDPFLGEESKDNEIWSNWNR